MKSYKTADPDHYIPAKDWEPVEHLPQAWGGFQEGWSFFKRLDLSNPVSLERPNEPVEVEVEFHASQVSDLAREVRVAQVETEKGPIREVPSQVYGDVAEDEVRRCRLFFIARLQANEKKTYLIYYGNPAAPPPAYQPDLQISGAG